MKKIIVFSSSIMLILLLLVAIDSKTGLIIGNTTYALTIDGVKSDTLPTSGSHYLTSYDCENYTTKLSWNKDSYELSIKNITKKQEKCNLTFESTPRLNKMEVGDYVKYVGDNGCLDGKAGTTGDGVAEAGNSCKGENANQSLDGSRYTYGYCYDSDYKYYVSGWRIAYKKGENVYLTTAGSPECLNAMVSYKYPVEFTDLNKVALKYCNKDYVDGDCSSSNTWAMGETDFIEIVKASSLSDCSSVSYGKKCGYNNDLIDNGGYYSFSYQEVQDSGYASETGYVAIWNAQGRYVQKNTGNLLYGFRPVIKLSSNVYVTGGSGTMEDPYEISI